MVNLAERFASVTCAKCEGQGKQVADVFERVKIPNGFSTNITRQTIDCVHCNGKGTIVNKEYLAVAEEALGARRSLAQEICEGLKVRGYWVPDDLDSADVINAVFLALEKERKHDAHS